MTTFTIKKIVTEGKPAEVVGFANQFANGEQVIPEDFDDLDWEEISSSIHYLESMAGCGAVSVETRSGFFISRCR